MLTVTDNASGHLNHMLTSVKAPKRFAIRFVVESSKGLTPLLDFPRSEDITFEYEGRHVLALSEGIAELLDDKTLDVINTSHGPKLAIL